MADHITYVIGRFETKKYLVSKGSHIGSVCPIGRSVGSAWRIISHMSQDGLKPKNIWFRRGPLLGLSVQSVGRSGRLGIAYHNVIGRFETKKYLVSRGSHSRSDHIRHVVGRFETKKYLVSKGSHIGCVGPIGRSVGWVYRIRSVNGRFETKK